ncbi:MAG: helix-turn-helix domain-containing protein [Dehalococcoidia bacterium]|nr:helix-turn-helix domain-containing protein [Dehalococcoidia bacterium]
MAEMTTSTVNRLENGKQAPRFATVRRLAKALGVRPSEINFSKNS